MHPLFAKLQICCYYNVSRRTTNKRDKCIKLYFKYYRAVIVSTLQVIVQKKAYLTNSWHWLCIAILVIGIPDMVCSFLLPTMYGEEHNKVFYTLVVLIILRSVRVFRLLEVGSLHCLQFLIFHDFLCEIFSSDTNKDRNNKIKHISHIYTRNEITLQQQTTASILSSLS